MNDDVKQKWLTALRSGDYEQGRAHLALITPEGAEYCCLGVLCDLAERAGLIETQVKDYGNNRIVYYVPHGVLVDEDPEYDQEMDLPAWSTTGLPKVVAQWAGLDSENPRVAGSTLADLNDREVNRYDFYRIADIIEQEL